MTCYPGLEIRWSPSLQLCTLTSSHPFHTCSLSAALCFGTVFHGHVHRGTAKTTFPSTKFFFFFPQFQTNLIPVINRIQTLPDMQGKEGNTLYILYPFYF